MAKTIAFWVALLVTAILLYSVFTSRPSGKETELNFSKFMEEVNNKNVKKATFVDADVTGELMSGEKFKTTIPAEYPAIYDKLDGVDYKIEHPTQSPWLAALISWLRFFSSSAFGSSLCVRCRAAETKHSRLAKAGTPADSAPEKSHV
jgi:cell division protease FtsH